ncbi:tellurite resistance TerB C-terminal domain-containing protein [Nodularia harveyana UHCC-0300]|uniref:Tellurite resistance TerB C-terminal domain-containing protein n=1 Tax=Nodularia harveyana UHCC-0300 TaxID=2974287 RepID=A0ABU5UF74_9CYAN|nr:tellurite resistance TerB C-terminal domain-containing protein [Nodularia harveyana]MEA5582218.1 tellurite resistance TerB C-terminal domain-containing protein [Nodularia harveyana UHCC-0300]
MQSAMISNRYILGLVAFSISFGISLVPKWDLNQALITAIITVLATYAAALFTDKRRSQYEMLILTSQRKRIREMEGLKLRLVKEINQIEEHRKLLYAESQKLEKQILDSRNQRDSIHRDLGIFAAQKKQLETESINITANIEKFIENQADLQNACSQLTTEKRRLELNSNTFRAEIMQLENQITDLQQEKQELESNVSLLGRLKPQLEEKMYELRIETQELETQHNLQKQLLVSTANERNNLADNLNYIQNQITENQSELQHISAQISLLQEERDLLQSQVWELLQQTETLNPELSSGNLNEEVNDVFPFAELIATIDTSDINEILPEEWQDFLGILPSHEIHVLKAIVEEDNPQIILKQVAETNITMPNLLIDAINEHANDTIGELIIATNLETPQVYEEHRSNVVKMLRMYEDIITRQASSN